MLEIGRSPPAIAPAGPRADDRSTTSTGLRVSLWRTPRTRAFLLVGTFGAAAAVVVGAAHVYTDLLWFREVGHEPVYWSTLKWRILAPAVVGLGTTSFVLANLALVERRGGTPPTAVTALWPVRTIIYAAVAFACGLASLDARPDEGWRLLALYANRTDFGTRDPLFHRDVSYFVFELPLYRAVIGWLLEMLLMAALATVAASALQGALRCARGHLLGLAALALALTAWRLRLDQFALAVPHGGTVVPGATYTDVHVRLPILRVMAPLALAAAALCAHAAWRPVRLGVLAVTAALGVLTVTAAGALPGLIQRVHVAPQALSRERPYVADAIAGTRRAFALDRVEVRQMRAAAPLTASAVLSHRRMLENVPLWDPSVLRPAINESQSIGGYYSFPSTSVDRYTVDGAPALMTVAARRLDLAHVARSARTWANTHFAYTHGYGVVAVHGGEADADRYPRFAQREFGGPRNPLGVTEPRIYFGERAPLDPPYVIVNSRRGEIERPVPGAVAPAYHYTGAGGIALSDPVRRAAFAVRRRDVKLLLTETITARSRILVHRDARERLRTVAPFLQWDARPQTVVAGGRVQFVFHGYTSSRSYPYAARVHTGVNYLRAPVLATVDAFDGRLRLYAVDAKEPILHAWARVHPGLFAPGAALPQALGAHLRYPRRLFDAQAEIYATYHASNPTGFWNGADAWELARELAGPVEDAGEIHFPDPRRGAAAPSAYLPAQLPGDRQERFVLTSAFTPRGRENLAAQLAGAVDPSGRPRLLLLGLRRDHEMTGPTQATRQILASPGVDARLQILNRESRDLGRNSVNRTVLGATRLVAVGAALVHAQPVYVTAGGSGFPRLQLVTVHANGRVGYGRDLVTALLRAAR